MAAAARRVFGWPAGDWHDLRAETGAPRPIGRTVTGVEDQISLVPRQPYQPGEDTEPPRSGRRRALASVGLLAVALVAVGVQHVRSGHLPAPAVAHLAPAA